jgi:MSHA biogenesis protein MshO
MSGPTMQRRQCGFTLIEAIAVIVITGVIGTFIAAFLKVPVNAYLASVGRAAASDLADNTMRRLARDLRLALPNSVRVSGNYIEYIDTKAGLRYLAEDDVGIAPPAPYLSWNSAALSFTVVGGVPTGRHAPVVGDSVVVYNLGKDQQPGDAYDCSGVCNRAAITALSGATITMASNPFFAQASAGTPLMSPGKRFHVVTTPVSYGCTGGRLIRYWNYGFQATQSAPPVGGQQAVLADNIASCSFSYTQASQRSGVIGITLRFTPQDGSNNPMTLLHQISVDNTP